MTRQFKFKLFKQGLVYELVLRGSMCVFYFYDERRECKKGVEYRFKMTRPCDFINYVRSMHAKDIFPHKIACTLLELSNILKIRNINNKSFTRRAFITFDASDKAHAKVVCEPLEKRDVKYLQEIKGQVEKFLGTTLTFN